MNASSLKIVRTPHPHERILTSYRGELLYQLDNPRLSNLFT